MNLNENWLSPCGLYCGVCGIMIAHKDNNVKFKEKLSKVYGLEPEQIACEGCLAPEDKVFSFCKVCPIKMCNKERNYQGCHQCQDFPCDIIENFPIAVGKKVINRAIPQRREMGTEKWVSAEEARYVCPECGNKLFRGAKRCRSCKTPVDVD